MSFHLDIREWCKKAKGRTDLVVRKVLIDLGTRLVEKSPVGNPDLWDSLYDTADAGSGAQRTGARRKPPAGYVGGRFRGNWQYGNLGQQSVPMQRLDDIDPSGAISISRITKGVLEAEPANMHYLVNNLPYAQRLENGWSKQAPQGMVALTVVEFQDIVRAATGGRE